MRRVRRYDFVGGSVSLGVGFEAVKPRAGSDQSLLQDQDVGCSSRLTVPAPCMSSC